MATLSLSGPAINVQGLGEFASGAAERVFPILLPNGNVAITFTENMPGFDPDKYWFATVDTATGAVTSQQIVERYANLAMGDGYLLGLSLPNTGAPAVQKLSYAGAKIGGATSIFDGYTQNFDMKWADSWEGGGFGVIASDQAGTSQNFDVFFFDKTGARTAVLLDAAPYLNVSRVDAATTKLSNGNIVFAWSLGDQSGAGMQFRIYTPAGAPVTNVINVATGLVNFQAWGAGSIELAPLPDGGFVLARGVRFQSFSATGEVTSQRGYTGAFNIEDIDVSPDGSITLYQTGTILGHEIDVFARSGTGANALWTESATLAYLPSATSPAGGVIGVANSDEPALRLADGSFLAFSSMRYGNISNLSAPQDTALLAQRFGVFQAPTPTTGNDILTGTPGPDVIDALAGDDFVSGLAGNDRLFGGAGIDQIYGGEGDDYIQGDAGASSVLSGDAGADTIYGGAGNDYMVGGEGNDVLVGLGGIDSLYGGAGNDYLVAGPGAGSVLDGGAGANSLWASSGADYLVGGEGTDILVGGAGADYIFGNAGGDAIYAGAGGDFIFGNAGNDFIYTDDIGASAKDYVYAGGGTGVDTVVDFKPGAGGDVLVVSKAATGWTNLSQLLAATTQVGVYAVVTMGADQVYLYNVQPFQLTAENVLFL